MQLGMIGVGHLASSLLTGFLRAGVAPEGIHLSPRGRGAELARKHGAALARSNEEVVARADIVLLTVRPVDAAAAVSGLRWREGQALVSLCAGVPIAAFAEAAPAEIARAMPLTAAELGASPTLLHPAHPAATALLGKVGVVIPLEREAQFEAATVSAAVYGWAQELIRLSADWSEAHGLPPGTARTLAARTFVAAGRMIAEKDAPMETLLTALMTPGGITEAGLRHLRENGAPEAWEGACDAVLRKLGGA